MIILKPSRTVEKLTGLDFDVINHILSHLYPSKSRKVIHVVKSRYDFSYFSPTPLEIGLELDIDLSLRFIIGTILHEYRHFIQYHTLKTNALFVEYDSYTEYWQSPEECDARKYEKLTTHVCKVYKELIAINEKIKTLKLDNLNELQYNLEKVNKRKK